MAAVLCAIGLSVIAGLVAAFSISIHRRTDRELHGLFETRRDGEHADQHGDDAGDAKDCGGHRTSPLRQAQQSELRDGADLRKPVDRAGHWLVEG